MINPAWDELFRKRSWGKWPNEELVRFFYKNFTLGGGSFLGDPPGNETIRVLELGCGTGANAQLFAAEEVPYVGIDGSPRAIEIARTWLQSQFFVGDISALTALGLGTFDFIFDVGCFMHNEDRAEILTQAFVALRPMGRVFFTEICATTCSAFIDKHGCDPKTVTINEPPFQNLPYHFFTGPELYSLFRTAGFVEIKVELLSRTYNNGTEFYDRYQVEATKP